jgi:hypothetical protein
MKTRQFILLGAAIIPLMVGCASQPVTLSPVGPAPHSAAASLSRGYLQVYSDTETHVIGDGPYYYPHSGYSVYDKYGVRVKYVPNHIGDMDESPTLISIPAGNYNVVAESSAYGRVTVPVSIQGHHKTIVHLDREWRPSLGTLSNELVHLPDGEAVGYASLNKDTIGTGGNTLR